MPYGGTTPDEDARIERCVADAMARGGYAKSNAIAICKSSIIGARKTRRLTRAAAQKGR